MARVREGTVTVAVTVQVVVLVTVIVRRSRMKTRAIRAGRLYVRMTSVCEDKTKRIILHGRECIKPCMAVQRVA